MQEDPEGAERQGAAVHAEHNPRPVGRSAEEGRAAPDRSWPPWMDRCRASSQREAPKLCNVALIISQSETTFFSRTYLPTALGKEPVALG